MVRMRPYFALLLTAVLVVTGLSVGATRAQSDVADPVVLCTGAGPVTIYLDENGEPTGQSHVCPDCVLNLLMGLPVSGFHLTVLGEYNANRDRFIQTHRTLALAIAAHARAPPVLS